MGCWGINIFPTCLKGHGEDKETKKGEKIKLRHPWREGEGRKNISWEIGGQGRERREKKFISLRAETMSNGYF
jgi:hypothetical protein